MERLAAPDWPGQIVVDLQATQSPGTRGRGIGRYALNWALALERHHPGIVSCYLLNADLPPPADLGTLPASGKVTYELPGASGGPRIFHSLSPFDLDVGLPAIWPETAFRSRWALSVTIYDLIPALDVIRELADPARRRAYRTRLELVRSAEGIQVLSHAVARQVEEVLSVEPRRITVTGAAATEAFVPPRSHADAHARACTLLGMSPDDCAYVLSPSGSHPRKNNEALIAAFGRIPEPLRAHRRLVICGEFDAPTAHHFRYLGEALGLGDSVVVPGYLADKELALLYQGADLVCVPSLAEGFGLPIVEALACETPVIASDRPPFDELLDDDARFDPSDTSTIAAAITSALVGGGTRLPPSDQPGRRQNWRHVADASAAAFDSLLHRLELRRPAPPRRRRRPRLAFVSPLPPAPTGVAAYSYRLIEAVCIAEKVDVEVFLDGPTSDQVAPFELPVHDVRALPGVESLTGRFDHVLYTLGNSHHHLGALASLRKRPGAVLAHDVRLSNLYRHESGDPGLLPGGLERAVASMYGGALPAGLGRNGELGAIDLERYGVLMGREVMQNAEVFLVSSLAAAALARIEAGPAAEARIGVVPFAFDEHWRHPLPFREVERLPAELPAGILARWGKGPALLGTSPLVAHFGIVDPAKSPELLVSSFARLLERVPAAELAFIGPISDALAGRLAALAEGFGVLDRLTLSGPLPPALYGDWLSRATIAVQLRSTFNGEASAAVGECLAGGVATVVSQIGFFAELPDDAVEKVPASLDDDGLAEVMAALLADEPRRRSLSRSGREEAERRSFGRSARALLALLEETKGAVARAPR